MKVMKFILPSLDLKADGMRTMAWKILGFQLFRADTAAATMAPSTTTNPTAIGGVLRPGAAVLGTVFGTITVEDSCGRTNIDDADITCAVSRTPIERPDCLDAFRRAVGSVGILEAADGKTAFWIVVATTHN